LHSRISQLPVLKPQLKEGEYIWDYWMVLVVLVVRVVRVVGLMQTPHRHRQIGTGNIGTGFPDTALFRQRGRRG
jgi:hypothetical protein